MLICVSLMAACGAGGAGAGQPDTGVLPNADAAPGANDSGSSFPAPVLDDCITDGSAGSHVFACDGYDFDVSVPAACLQQACGLIVDVHGYTMSAAMQDANTNMRALGREHGFIVVQPNANPDPPLSSWSAADDGAVLSFIERVAAGFHVDGARWYFTGFSQGGFMSWRFVCKYADRFAAIAPVAGCSAGGLNACQLDQLAELPGETHILYMHGTRDTIVPATCIAPQRDAVLAAYEFDDSSRQVISSDANYTRTRWTNPRGITFELIEHDYASDNSVIGGHCFPGSDDPGDQPGQVASFACAAPTAFDWGTTVMEFFLAH